MVANRMRFTCRVALLAAGSWMLLMPGIGHARGALTDDPDRMFHQAAQDIGFRYETEFTGVGDRSLRKLLKSASRLVTLEDRPPPTLAALERRARSRWSRTSWHPRDRRAPIDPRPLRGDAPHRRASPAVSAARSLPPRHAPAALESHRYGRDRAADLGRRNPAPNRQ